MMRIGFFATLIFKVLKLISDCNPLLGFYFKGKVTTCQMLKPVLGITVRYYFISFLSSS